MKDNIKLIELMFKYYILNLIQLILLICFFISSKFIFISSIAIMVLLFYIMLFKTYSVRKHLHKDEQETFNQNVKSTKIIIILNRLFYIIYFFSHIFVIYFDDYKHLLIKFLLISLVILTIIETVTINIFNDFIKNNKNVQ